MAKSQEKNQDSPRESSENVAQRNLKQINRSSEQIARNTGREMSRQVSRQADNFMTPFLNMQKQMNRIMEDMFGSMTDIWAGQVDKMMPKVRVWEDRDAFHLKTRLPQNNPDNIEVAINDNILTLRWHEDQSNNEGPHQFFSSHDAYRTVMIPDNADPEQAEAVCENGCLEIIMPKKEDAQENARSIPIRRNA